MPLPAPELDNRTSQSIVDEAKRMIPQFCPEWTDHNVSDPGVTLIELFAWMTEMLLYRVNQVPAKNYVKFLEMLGLKLRPPQAAEVNITFYLSAPLDQLSSQPKLEAGTEVATARTELKNAVAFSTLEDLNLRSPQLGGALTYSQRLATEERIQHDLNVLRDSDGVITMFSNPPVHASDAREGDAFYLVFANNLSRHVISLSLEFREGKVVNVTSDNPPRVWQAWANGELNWVNCQLEHDDTAGLTRNGEIILRLPEMAKKTEHGVVGYWLRCALTQPVAGQHKYVNSPGLQRKISACTLGGTVRAKHAVTAKDEFLGISDGSPGQRFQFPHSPLLERNPHSDYLSVIGEPGQDTATVWTEVSDFGDSNETSLHYTIDDLTGVLSLGPALRQPDGSMRRFGKVPARGAELRFTRYNYGGGTEGNVRAESIVVLKSAKAYISKAINWEPSVGGRDAESVEQAILRVPAMLRSHERAVTADDYEYHAKTIAGVADAYCVGPGLIRDRATEQDKKKSSRAEPPKPGEVHVYILPQVGHTVPLRFEQLKLDETVRQRVQTELQSRSVLGVTVKVMPVTIVEISVEAKLVSRDRASGESLKRQAQEAIERFLNPFTGGPQGNGWRQISVLHKSDLYRLLLNLPMVEHIEEIFIKRGPDRETNPAPLELGRIVVCSGEHQIEIAR